MTGAGLKALRLTQPGAGERRAHLTQREAAAQMGISPRTYERYERCDVVPDHIAKLAQLLWQRR